MSILFQLFNTGDLDKLNPRELEELMSIIGARLSSQEVARHVWPYALKVYNYMKADAQKLNRALLPEDPDRVPPGASKALALIYRLFTAQEIDSLDAKQLDILRMGIECALNVSRTIRDAVGGDPEELGSAKEVLSRFLQAHGVQELLPADLPYTSIDV